ncbi:restriction endonuclease subunit S [Muriicola sp. Z0-33]|uniref:restriction endonuclease subunit S n=1 Tax=Muriicola sp. Z0-33 TaxID=2816957 RepID=UPI00223817A9|nr:restriction endonuclease subunit S [Muriicola sp. Z0-33]MCW5514721.1 restriction endonuclease subunit S [Muriicola sp. Z0-33]
MNLGDIADIKRGLASQHLNYVENSDEGIRLIRINDFKSNSPKFIEETEETKKLTVRKGDLLMAGTGATAGISFLVKELWDGLPFSYNAPRIRVKEGNDSKYIYYVLNSDKIKKQQNKLFTGNAQPFLDTRAMASFKIPVPPLPEQQKIAEILSTVDAKIEVIDQQITETQELKKGLMQRLLTKGIGHTEFKDSPLGKIPKSWEVVKIGDVLTLGGGKDYKHLSEGNIPVYGTGGVMTYVDEYLYDGESVGIGRKGTIDKPVFLNGKFWTVDTLFYTHSFVGVIPFYVYVVFQSINWRKHSEATGVPSLSRSIIDPIRIPLPSLTEQNKIVDIFQSIDEKLEVLLEKKTNYQELKQGLMQQLLTGKVRVQLNNTIIV